MKSKKCFVLTLIIFSLIFYSCSNHPKDEKVIVAIKAEVENNFPSSWSDGLLNGKHAKVDSIKIIKFGEYKEIGKYWPVKAKIWGTYDVDYLVKSESKKFNKIGDFKLFKDDYGDLQVKLKIE